MVKVAVGTIDQSAAWRVRDTLASHPLLGGATACITVLAGPDRIVLEGWTFDEHVRQIAVRMAMRTAGHRPVQSYLHIRSVPRVRANVHRLVAPDAR